MSRPPLGVYVEAAVALSLARMRILLSPGRRHFLGDADRAPPASLDDIALVRRTITAAARRLPVRTLCFEQALAARAMLRRRGRSAQLHFGGGKREGSLTAHVWLTSGDHFVVGEEEAASHVELASSA